MLYFELITTAHTQALPYNVNTKYVFAYEVSPMSDKRCVKGLQNEHLAPPGTMVGLVTDETMNASFWMLPLSHLFYS